MFPHESLHSYQLAVVVAQWAHSVRWPVGLGDLKNQAQRASSSVVLNIAEGHQRSGRARLNHYGIAAGSAAEVSAVLDIVKMPDGAEMKHNLDRIGAMLRRMRQR